MKNFEGWRSEEGADARLTISDQSEKGIARYAALCSDFTADIDDLTAQLDPHERHVVHLAAAYATHRWDHLEGLAERAVADGMTSVQIAEICLQMTIYSGVAGFSDAMRKVALGVERTGSVIEFDENPLSDVPQTAANMRDFLHGERQYLGHANPQNAFSAPLYNAATFHGYGLIWNRPGLELRNRLVLAVAALAVVGPMNVLGKFALAAVSHGLSRESLRAIVIQTVLCQGNSRAQHALVELEELFSDLDKPD
ncbi:carboxymuconolactone decarboxylase family protein [uncultured Ruegeria sp.]|uniref:carboxymuconolactone decarboxylase family protein n=1 Tax=uncultured Ruegeria sp. TaxID=259304 RepID=UPI002619708B|nr:carboxymuconolactone decarboxylase family protein [uncultured Ruegeria sp.]